MLALAHSGKRGAIRKRRDVSRLCSVLINNCYINHLYGIGCDSKKFQMRSVALMDWLPNSGKRSEPGQ